jgi:nucleotide-binding universal stress UspA family protein
VRDEGRYVVAGVDGPPAEVSVRHVAGVVAELMGAAVRAVHVEPGPGLRGEARRSAMARVTRGETENIVGRPETVLTALAETPGAVMTVLGVRQAPRRPGARRGGGTAMAVARRATFPLLLVPPAADGWGGPGRVLSALDGTGLTALAAASALSGITGPHTVALPLHVADGPDPATAWAGQSRDLSGWTAETGSAGTEGAHQRLRTRPLGRHVLDQADETASDLVVLVWSRHTRGPYGAAVLDVLSATRVPVLLVPVLSPSAAA